MDLSDKFSDEYLAELWENIDWKAAEEKLANWQEELSKAAYRHDDKAIIDVQRRIVRDLNIRCLAVKKVVTSGSGPGVDGVKWSTHGEMMRAAMALTKKDYHASPLRVLLLTAKNTGRQRKAGIPTYHDKAMQVLYGFSLIPVAEARADKKSFAFRPGRSTQDAQAYILDATKGTDAPSIVITTDIEAFYSSLMHSWLMRRSPMDKYVLNEMLNAGQVFAGELFPAEDVGISEGANLSPYLANIMLDGLQGVIYRGLQGEEQEWDYDNGNMVRFADDMFVAVRTYEDANRVLEILEEFMASRGLTLSKEKTKIADVTEGFTFLSVRYVKKHGVIYCYPAEHAIERVISESVELIQAGNLSQRFLIERLNKKLYGWGSYFRTCDAEEAFRRVDSAIQTALLDAARERHPRMQLAKVISKYWYKEADGRFCYALPQDRSVRLIRLADILLIHHQKIRASANPYIDADYMENRTHEREITNVTGSYKAIWARQNGRCYYCGRPILVDQPRTLIQMDLRGKPGLRNFAYIHQMCGLNEYEVINWLDDVSLIRHYDILSVLEEIDGGEQENDTPEQRRLSPLWQHWGLKEYLRQCTAPHITLTFKEIEKLNGNPLPPSAFKHHSWWYPRKNSRSICEAWTSEGYALDYLDMKHAKIRLRKNTDGMIKLEIPAILTEKRLPENAIFELERFMGYVIKKYGLK